MSWRTWFRFGANWFLPVILILTYLNAMFFDPTQFVGDASPTTEGSIPKDTWNSMSPTAKGLGPQLGGWALCYALIVAGFLYFEPTQRTHQLMAKLNAFLMLVWWQVVWYIAMLPNQDFSPMDAKTYFNKMSLMEVPIGLVYIYCGWFISASEEKTAKD